MYLRSRGRFSENRRRVPAQTLRGPILQFQKTIDRSQKPRPLVIVTTPVKQLRTRTIAMAGLISIPIGISDWFWSNAADISSRARQKGLQYAVEGYVQ